jgi:hypothetical protein
MFEIAADSTILYGEKAVRIGENTVRADMLPRSFGGRK